MKNRAGPFSGFALFFLRFKELQVLKAFHSNCYT